MKTRLQLRGALAVFVLIAATVSVSQTGPSNPSNVQLDIQSAKPRAVESLTAQHIARDYGQAWANLAAAFNNGNPDALAASFTGDAKDSLSQAIAQQKQSGVHTRYLGQSHKLQVTFYSPEGDLMELHDTATCDMQLLDGTNVIRDEHATVKYIVLMTPSVDGWVVRQLQAVPNF